MSGRWNSGADTCTETWITWVFQHPICSPSPPTMTPDDSVVGIKSQKVKKQRLYLSEARIAETENSWVILGLNADLGDLLRTQDRRQSFQEPAHNQTIKCMMGNIKHGFTWITEWRHWDATVGTFFWNAPVQIGVFWCHSEILNYKLLNYWLSFLVLPQDPTALSSTWYIVPIVFFKGKYWSD